MKIREINRLNAGVVVPDFMGRVVKVYPPTEPTSGQARAGIHKQNIIVQAADGEELSVTIMKAALHMSHEDAGKLFQFQSTKDDRDRLGGIVTCEYHNERNGDDKFYVELNGQANFFAVKEAEEIKAVGTPRAGNAKAAKQMAAGEFTPSVMDHVNFYTSIVTSLEEQVLAGSRCADAILANPAPLFASATSIFIQGCQNGTFRRFVTPAQQINEPVGQYEKPPVPVYQEHQSDGRYNERMLADDLHAGNAELVDEDIIDKHKLSAEKVYDQLVVWWLDDGTDQPIIDACYDYLKNVMSRGGKNHVTADDVCREIVRDYRGFVELFPKAEADREKQRAKKMKDGPAETSPHSDFAAEDAGFNPADVFTEELLDSNTIV
jgi:hypothetical protein